MNALHRVTFICVVTALCLCRASAADAAVVAGYETRAAQALLEGRFDDAFENYEHIRTKLADTEALFISATVGMVKSLFVQRKFQEGLTVLNLANTVYLDTIKGNIQPLGPGSQAVLSYWRGRILFATDNVDGALPILRSLLKTADLELQAEAGLYYGRCFIAKEEYVKAQTHFKGMILDRNPRSARAQAGRAGMLEVLLKTQEWEEFDKVMASAELLATGKWSLEYTYLKIRRLLNDNNVMAAHDVYRATFLDVKPADLSKEYRIHLQDHAFYLAVRQMGLNLSKAGEYRKARTFYVDLQPRLPLDYQQQEILMDMATCAFNAMKVAKSKNDTLEVNTWFTLADDDLKRFIRKYPNSVLAARVIYYQGQMLLEQDKADEAMTAFKNAYEHKQAPPLSRYEAALQLAVSLQNAGKTKEAIAWYASAATQSVKPNLRARAEFDRALLLDSINQTNDAMAAFAGIVERFPTFKLIHEARFNHANAAFKERKFAMATSVFGEFLRTAPPAMTLRPKAMHLQGLSYRELEKWDNAKSTLFALAKKYPTHALAPRALLDAAEIASMNNNDDEFLKLCSKVIKDYSDREEKGEALYRRIHHYISIDLDIDKAEVDRVTYFSGENKFAESQPDAAVSILMWFGNFYFDIQSYEKAEGFFAKAANDFPDSSLVPEALYELAKSAYNRELKSESSLFKDAIKHLKRLEAVPIETVKSKWVLPQAYMLHGDILSIKSEFAKAKTYFIKCRDVSKAGENTYLRLYYPAVGRIGDMNYSLVGNTRDPEEKKRLLSSAIDNYTAIIESESAHASMKEKARYHRGLVHEVMKNELAAETDFREVLEGYFIKLHSDNPLKPDNYFMIKAAMKLIEYYLKSNQTQRAIAIFERIQTLDDPEFGDWATLRLKALKEDPPKDFPAPPLN